MKDIKADAEEITPVVDNSKEGQEPKNNDEAKLNEYNALFLKLQLQLKDKEKKMAEIYTPDNLFAGNVAPVVADIATIVSGAGVLTRGTVLGTCNS